MKSDHIFYHDFGLFIVGLGYAILILTFISYGTIIICSISYGLNDVDHMVHI